MNRKIRNLKVCVEGRVVCEGGEKEGGGEDEKTAGEALRLAEGGEGGREKY